MTGSTSWLQAVTDVLPNTDELLAHNAHYVERTSGDHDLAGDLGAGLLWSHAWTAGWTSSTCWDSRTATAHIIRNAGGVVTDDVIRSLVLAQRLLGTREIILLHHTDCGMQQVIGDHLKDEIEAETGLRPSWAFENFKDPYQNVAQSIRRLQMNPFIEHKDHVRGFVYRVESGHLDEVTP